MNIRPANDHDLQLVQSAQDTIAAHFDAVRERHTVAASLRTITGEIISAVNVFANCGYGPCAEAVAIGLAATLGKGDFSTIVAVGGPDQHFPILPPCGNCRQLLIEYAPTIEVILKLRGDLVVVPISDLLPINYEIEV